jgi:hypothetical protein
MAPCGGLSLAQSSLVLEGANDFLHSLANLWDVLDEVLLQSGSRGDPRAAVITV